MIPTPLTMDKATLRTRLLQCRKAMPENAKIQASNEIFRQVTGLSAWKKARVVLLYLPVNGEVDTWPLFEDSLRRNCRTFLPCCRKDEPGCMDFFRVTDRDQLVPGAYGILEPDRTCCSPMDESSADIILVPGVGFDHLGHRIGYGGGYYDRFLTRHPMDKALVLGLAFSCQLVDPVPQDPWDKKVHVLVTEKGLVWTPCKTRISRTTGMGATDAASRKFDFSHVSPGQRDPFFHHNQQNRLRSDQTPPEEIAMTSCIPFTFPGLPNIHCTFGTRRGGTSTGPFAGNNISLEVGDQQETVLANRRALQNKLGFSRWTELKQVHGCEVIFDSPKNDLLGTDTPGDGLATCQEHVGLVIKTADCQPIFLAHASGKYIAAIHCGWKGNRQNFPCKAVTRFCQTYGLEPKDILAVRGPSLGPTRSEFTHFDREWGEEFTLYFDPATQTVDLWQLTRDQLTQAGLTPKNIFSLDLCTQTMDQWFFSYRRSQVCGRQASIIWMQKQ